MNWPTYTRWTITTVLLALLWFNGWHWVLCLCLTLSALGREVELKNMQSLQRRIRQLEAGEPHENSNG